MLQDLYCPLAVDRVQIFCDAPQIAVNNCIAPANPFYGIVISAGCGCIAVHFIFFYRYLVFTDIETRYCTVTFHKDEIFRYRRRTRCWDRRGPRDRSRDVAGHCNFKRAAAFGNGLCLRTRRSDAAVSRLHFERHRNPCTRGNAGHFKSYPAVRGSPCAPAVVYPFTRNRERHRAGRGQADVTGGKLDRKAAAGLVFTPPGQELEDSLRISRVGQGKQVSRRKAGSAGVAPASAGTSTAGASRTGRTAVQVTAAFYVPFMPLPAVFVVSHTPH